MEKDKIKDKIDKHNDLIKERGVNVEFFLILKTGAKGKRFTLYKYEAYKLKNGKYIPSRSFLGIVNKNFIKYLDSPEQILPYLKNIKYRDVLFEIKQFELNTSETASVEKWKFLQFGKYAKTNIDELPKIDYGYCVWLIKNSTERKFKSEWFNQLDEYIISQSFQDKVLKAKFGYKDDWEFKVNTKDFLCNISDIDFGFPLNHEIIKKNILFFQQKKDCKLHLFTIKDKSICDKIIKDDKIICEIDRDSLGVKINVIDYDKWMKSIG